MTMPARLDIEGPFPRPKEGAYDPEPGRDRVRGILAICMVALLSGCMLLSYLWIAAGWMKPTDAKDVLGSVFPPVVALTGTVLGFYFGGKNRP
jgi:hypothetical protein